MNLTRKELRIRAENTKTDQFRALPISSRLAGVLEMARTSPDTQLREAEGPGVSADDHGAAIAKSYAFGDLIGGKVDSIKRAWLTAGLKAHGYTPEWTSSNMLAGASRNEAQSIDLHFHDLRHEAGSRWLEAGWPLHHVQAMLGHANLSQTSTYLNATKTGLHHSMKRLEEFAPGCNPVANNPQIDPSRNCNDIASAAGKLLVN